MKVKAIKTRVMVPPKDDLFCLIKKSVKEIPEKSIVAVTSKVIAIHQGRCIPLSSGVERDYLAKKEADWYVERDIVPGEHLMFTIKSGSLVASAGIDKSNAKDHFILWPEKLEATAKEIYAFLKKEYRVSKLGVVITDSHVTPLRRGIIGQAIAHFGFNPVYDYRGEEDIFGYEMRVSIKNVADSLAIAAVAVQGEASEQTPLALITDIDWVEFSEDDEVNRGKPEFMIPREEDLFEPMLGAVEWKKGGGGLSNQQVKQLRNKGKR